MDGRYQNYPTRGIYTWVDRRYVSLGSLDADKLKMNAIYLCMRCLEMIKTLGLILLYDVKY